MEAQLRLNILPGYPIYLGSFIFERESGWLESLNLWSIDPEDRSSPSTIGLSAGCHEARLNKIDIGQFLYTKYRVGKNRMIPIYKPIESATFVAAACKIGIDINNENTSTNPNICGYLLSRRSPSLFTKILSLFRVTLEYFLRVLIIPTIDAIRSGNPRNISESGMLSRIKPVATNMSQNIRFQKLSFDRSLFFMVVSVFYIYRFHYIIL